MTLNLEAEAEERGDDVGAYGNVGGSNEQAGPSRGRMEEVEVKDEDEDAKLDVGMDMLTINNWIGSQNVEFINLKNKNAELMKEVDFEGKEREKVESLM